LLETQLAIILFGQQAIRFNWLYDNNVHYERKLRKHDNHNHVSASTSHVSPATAPRNRQQTAYQLGRGALGVGRWAMGVAPTLPTSGWQKINMAGIWCTRF